MGWLDKFRIVELTTYSNKKKYKPQVLVYTNEVTTGMWWWKETKIVEDWCSFMLEKDGTLMFDYVPRHTFKKYDELVYDSEEQAKEAIEKFKADMKKHDDKSFKSETKIIEV